MTSKRWNESDDPRVWAQRVAYLRARALSGGSVEPNIPAITDEMVLAGAQALDPDAFSFPLEGYGEGAAAQARQWALESARDVIAAALTTANVRGSDQ